jgi:hypothetical protein
MGTIMNGRADVFRTIAASVANHRGTQLVLSIGDRLDPKQIGPVPSNAIIVNQAVDPGALLIPAISYSSNVGEPSIT